MQLNGLLQRQLAALSHQHGKEPNTLPSLALRRAIAKVSESKDSQDSQIGQILALIPSNKVPEVIAQARELLAAYDAEYAALLADK